MWKRMLYVVVLLTVLVLGCTKSEADVNFVFGDQFSGIEVGSRLGCVGLDAVELGVFAGVDYFGGGNSLSTMDIDTGGNLLGPNVKLHLLDTWTKAVDMFVSTTWLFRNGKFDVDRGGLVCEAGLMIRVIGNLKIGASYLYSEDLPETDYLMLRLSPLEF